MQNKHTPDINKTHTSVDIEDGNVNTLIEDVAKTITKHLGPQCDVYEEGCATCEIWVALQSQADEYEREKGEMVREIQKELQEPSFAGVMDSNEKRRGYQIGIAEATSLVVDVAKKYGVDLSE